MKVYAASSFRNAKQPLVVHRLRAAGHEVYDFHEAPGFHWSDIDLDWEHVGAGKRSAILLDPAIKGEPETMFKLADIISMTIDGVLNWLDSEFGNG